MTISTTMALMAGAAMLAPGLAAASGPGLAHTSSARPLCATKPAPPSGGSGRHGRVPARGAGTHGRDVWSFVSAPGLHPMRVTVTARRPGIAPGQVLVAPYSARELAGQTGSLILGNSGDPVWFRPLSSASLENTDLRVQTYRDPRTGTRQPVLTWWQGTIALPPTYTNLPAGAPEPGGCYYLYDTHYRLIRTISARNGFSADEHEFLLTPQGTALFIASRPVPMDLRAFGGPENGAIEDNEVQEISLATGKLIFSWDMLRHVNPADSEVPASEAVSSSGVWDPYHMNSVAEGPGGQLLISARDTWAIYDISQATGKIRWQLGGRHSDFTPGPGASFSWQHDARFRPGNLIGMLDNGCCGPPGGAPGQQSHGLVLRLDFQHHSAAAVRAYYHQPALSVPTQGNSQALGNGDEFIGWGQSGYYSEYAGAGNSRGHGSQNLRYDAKMPGSNMSYRAFRQVWTAAPYYPPSAAARASGVHAIVYASWNGSTQTRAWQVLAGRRPGSLSVAVRHATQSGFETAIAVPSRGPYFRVRALNAAGKVLRSSGIVTLPGVLSGAAAPRPCPGGAGRCSPRRW